MKNKTIEDLENFEEKIDSKLRLIKKSAINIYKMRKLNQGTWAYMEKLELFKVFDEITNLIHSVKGEI